MPDDPTADQAASTEEPLPADDFQDPGAQAHPDQTPTVPT